MLNLFYKKTKNTSRDMSNAEKLNIYSETVKDGVSLDHASSKTNNGETRHYPPATKE
jgi:hypothetical protein